MLTDLIKRFGTLQKTRPPPAPAQDIHCSALPCFIRYKYNFLIKPFHRTNAFQRAALFNIIVLYVVYKALQLYPYQHI